jgi:hypothetical protein
MAYGASAGRGGRHVFYDLAASLCGGDEAVLKALLRIALILKSGLPPVQLRRDQGCSTKGFDTADLKKRRRCSRRSTRSRRRSRCFKTSLAAGGPEVALSYLYGTSAYRSLSGGTADPGQTGLPSFVCGARAAIQ